MKAWVPLVAFALALSPLAVVHPLTIAGRSMEPALHDGELCWALRAWCAGPPQRGQVWAVQAPEGTSVKRIIGLPSEHVDAKDGGIFINGQRLDEFYVQRDDRLDGAWDCRDGFLLLGDNRRESHDGRRWGALPPSALKDRVLGHF